MGQVLDVVPNHMSTAPENRYWWDVLENGPSNQFATWFDIEWNSPEVKLGDFHSVAPAAPASGLVRREFRPSAVAR
jgi:maltooligosyltrehalose synthase